MKKIKIQKIDNKVLALLQKGGGGVIPGDYEINLVKNFKSQLSSKQIKKIVSHI